MVVLGELLRRAPAEATAPPDGSTGQWVLFGAVLLVVIAESAIIRSVQTAAAVALVTLLLTTALDVANKGVPRLSAGTRARASGPEADLRTA